MGPGGHLNIKMSFDQYKDPHVFRKEEFQLPGLSRSWEIYKKNQIHFYD